MKCQMKQLRRCCSDVTATHDCHPVAGFCVRESVVKVNMVTVSLILLLSEDNRFWQAINVCLYSSKNVSQISDSMI